MYADDQTPAPLLSASGYTVTSSLRFQLPCHDDTSSILHPKQTLCSCVTFVTYVTRRRKTANTEETKANFLWSILLLDTPRLLSLLWLSFDQLIIQYQLHDTKKNFLVFLFLFLKELTYLILFNQLSLFIKKKVPFCHDTFIKHILGTLGTLVYNFFRRFVFLQTYLWFLERIPEAAFLHFDVVLAFTVVNKSGSFATYFMPPQFT